MQLTQAYRNRIKNLNKFQKFKQQHQLKQCIIKSDEESITKRVNALSEMFAMYRSDEDLKNNPQIIANIKKKKISLESTNIQCKYSKISDQNEEKQIKKFNKIAQNLFQNTFNKENNNQKCKNKKSNKYQRSKQCRFSLNPSSTNNNSKKLCQTKLPIDFQCNKLSNIIRYKNEKLNYIKQNRKIIKLQQQVQQLKKNAQNKYKIIFKKNIPIKNTINNDQKQYIDQQIFINNEFFKNKKIQQINLPIQKQNQQCINNCLIPKQILLKQIKCKNKNYIRISSANIYKKFKYLRL